VLGRSSWFEPLYPYYEGALSGGRGSGRGKLAKIEVASPKREEYQGKFLGERLRKEGSGRGLDIRRSQVRFPPLRFFGYPSFRVSCIRVSEQGSDVDSGSKIEDRRGARGERALKAERAQER
jgi:hypothetical protein